ncbi:nucleoside-diphosphate-sugar epimerase [Neobacillus niacini]|uniref:SDR family oxidoreductase n=1 Tax=Neobacillus driksii TaxID=3035913 RepID=UPI0027863B0F|nr:SDR family oxidoreductase [Neobacillus niacini]MDQ0972917.1 nucleoside-diphosphate-sugar epimerase [Neobacillus niacini]
MNNGYFFTGFPGYICNQLIREVLKKNELKGIVYVLVLQSMMDKARKERHAIITELGLQDDLFILIEGDITQPSLLISDETQEILNERVTHVFHLAAIFDLAVPGDIAFRINVDGTNNVNKWVRGLTQLKRYVYFSTAYVVGEREGILYETELIRPTSFKNHYEETKYEAEVLVEKLKEEVPITIIRPGIVKGHSQTGETIKFDGPYFIMNFSEKLKFLPILPKLGKGEAYVNLVPIDYIIQATTYLSFFENGIGKTYHLTDPRPYRASEIYIILMEELLNKKPIGTLPLSVGKGFLSIKPMRKYLGVEKEALDYFTWTGHFDCTQAVNDLKESGIRCPDFKDGVKAMTAFYLEQKDNPNYQIHIL